MEQLSTDLKPDFPGGVFCYFTAEKHLSTPFRLPANVYLVVLKVGLTTYANKMKSSPEALLQEFSKNNVLDRL